MPVKLLQEVFKPLKDRIEVCLIAREIASYEFLENGRIADNNAQNGFSLAVLEVTDQTWIDGPLICRYMADVCSLGSYPVVSMEGWLKVKEKLPLAQIPKK